MVETREVLINGKWPLVLPEHRAQREEWATGWEPVRLDSMFANLKPGMVLYDIGTEEGDLSALFAKWVACDVADPDDGRPSEVMHAVCGVVLVEPNPRVWPNIRCIWEANDLPHPLWCLEGFVADDDRNLDYGQHAAISEDPELHGWPASAYGEVIGDHGFRNVHEHPEQATVTVDTIARDFAQPPDAITMDVEGAEWLVARGAQATLIDHRPLVWVSLHAESMFDQYGIYQVEFHSQFHQCGYEKVLLDFDHELHVFYFPSERRSEVVLP